MSEYASPEFNDSLSLMSDTQNAIFFIADKSHKKEMKDYESLLGAMTALHLAAFQRTVEAVLDEEIFVNSISKAAVIASILEHASERRAKALNSILEVEGFGIDHDPEDPYELKEYIDSVSQADVSAQTVAAGITKSFSTSFQNDMQKAYDLLNPPEVA